METTPVLKEIKPINFLFYRTEVKVSELTEAIPVARELFKEAVRHDLHVTGPIHWHYFGFSGENDKSFLLEVSLPVSQVLKDYDGKFHFKRTEVFKCISLIHEGGWDSISKGYLKGIEYANEKNLKPTAMNREVYLNADFQFPEANVTEIQIGVD